MKKIRLALLAVVLVAAAYLAPNDGWTHKTYAAGCGDQGSWHQLAYATNGNTDPLGQNASTDITLWQDGCGNAQVRYSVWSRTGSRLTGIQTAGRIWVCGGSGGGNPTFRFQIFSNVYWSGWFNAANCGIGADDALGGAGNVGTQACSAACYNADNFGVFYDNI